MIRDLHLYDRVVVGPDGVEHFSSGAELMVGEREAGVGAPTESGAPSPRAGWSPLLDDPDRFDDEGLIEVVISLDRRQWQQTPSAEVQELRDRVEGRFVSSYESRRAFVDERSSAGKRALAPVLQQLGAWGAEVTTSDVLVGTIQARVNREQLARLERLPMVIGVEPWLPEEEDAGYYYFVDGEAIDGRELSDLLQSEQFYLGGWYGDIEDLDADDGVEHLGLAESGGDEVYRAHLGFHDGSGNDRFQNCRKHWLFGTCINDDPIAGGQHPTGAASILLGDITRGQDGTVPYWLNREERSGVARRAHGVGLATGDISRLQDPDWGTHILSKSATNYETDLECTGTPSLSKTANAMYEAGVAVFNSHGNRGHLDPDDCTVTDPGSAIGVFTVGAYEVSALDQEVDFPSNSRGGTANEGRRRSIIDIIAPTNIEFPYPYRGDLSFYYGADWQDPESPPPNTYGASSGSTPTVAGSAALFRDYYLDTFGHAIDAPGLLYANMLLMGDRSTYDQGLLTTGYSNLWGAGKLRLRRFDGVGMEAPAGYGTGSLCVAHGQSRYVDITDGIHDLHPAVDMIKAVAWWYDHRHDGATLMHDSDRVSLTLLRSGPLPGTWFGLRTSGTTDNKQRVYYEDPGERQLHLRLTGTDVSSDLEGCGTNATRVYYAWFYESSDRDNGNTWQNDHIRPEGNP
ncbi:MAG: S8 family serine peptidase [Deltaproteobacteria bacterium]|nr:S8 family serine peptidase [Deltaproteobacteria bacterium]